MNMDLLIVSGFGRCGTSLVMQMLAAGGITPTGQWPAFEDPVVIRLTPDWIAKNKGKALKVLDPHRFRIPAGPKYRVLWLDRDHKEQAKSLMKFLGATVGIGFSPRDHKELARAFKRDRPRALQALQSAGAKDVLTLRFEDILSGPQGAAEAIAAFVEMRLDVSAMARAVMPRGPECRPDLSMEVMLSQKGDPQ